MLGYGVDPLYGEAHSGLGFRVLSGMKLPYEKMNGGYASHFGINPGYFRTDTLEGKGVEFRDKIINPLFYNPCNPGHPALLSVCQCHHAGYASGRY